jgi:hypothetical protein
MLRFKRLLGQQLAQPFRFRSARRIRHDRRIRSPVLLLLHH